jgi:hypothetical protein
VKQLRRVPNAEETQPQRDGLVSNLHEHDYRKGQVHRVSNISWLSPHSSEGQTNAIIDI